MEVLERNIANDALGPLLDCVDGFLNFGNVFFGDRGVNNDIFHQLIYGLVELHVH